MNTKRKELIIIITMIMASLIMIFVMKKHNSGGSNVVVTYDGNVYGTYQLAVDQEITIETELGCNVLKIENGKASVISGTCPDKICVNMHAISEDLPGVIVCLPNKIVIQVE